MPIFEKFVAFSLVLSVVYSSQPIVKANTGKYVGVYSYSYEGTKYMSFKGIKYATAARFEEAEAVPYSEETFQATKFGDNCFQILTGSEDCLYLNVYTCNNPYESKPVFVFIHGGAYIVGSGDNYEPAMWMDDCSVVFVTINYRLGPFGFLYFHDTSIQYPSNLGLRDVITSLRWVDENISYFGGDNTKIVIYGQSAGGAMVDMLIRANPAYSMGNFMAGISSSGSTCASWAMASKERAKKATWTLANNIPQCKQFAFYLAENTSSNWRMNFTRPLGNELIQCLKNVSPQELGIAGSKLYIEPDKWPIPFQPVIDHQLVMGYPWMYKPQREIGTPWISGANEREDIHLIAESILSEEIKEKIVAMDNWKNMFDYKGRNMDEEYANKMISNHFSLNNSSGKLMFQKVMRILSKQDFYYGNYKCMQSKSQGLRNYNYYFAHRPFGSEAVGHCGELLFLFPSISLGRDEIRTAKTLIKLFIEFAEDAALGTYYRQDIQAYGVKWEAWDLMNYDDTFDYPVLFITKDRMTVMNDPQIKTYEFWENLQNSKEKRRNNYTCDQWNTDLN